MSDKRKEHKSPGGRKKGQSRSYLVRITDDNGERGVVLSEVGQDEKESKDKYPPCLANHIVRPLF